jgi:hypothetical protein
LPSEQHETRLAELAKRFDEDVAAIRDDFTVFVGMESRAASTDPWKVEFGFVLPFYVGEVIALTAVQGDAPGAALASH